MDVAIAAGSCFLSTIATGLSIRLAILIGAVDEPNSLVPTHYETTPRLGGIGITTGTIFGAALTQQVFSAPELFGLVILLILGVYKDVTRADVWPPLQAIIQGIACYLATIGYGFSNYETILIVVAGVALVNAVNFLDVADGLCGSVSVIVAAALFFLTRSAVALALTFALAGFLPWNFPKAKTFMGDSGSFFIGLILFESGLRAISSGVSPLVLLFVFLTPCTELLWTIGVRLGRGRSPFVGDASHLSLMLLHAGVSLWSLLTIFAVAAAISAVVAICLR